MRQKKAQEKTATRTKREKKRTEKYNKERR